MHSVLARGAFRMLYWFKIQTLPKGSINKYKQFQSHHENITCTPNYEVELNATDM